MCSRTQGRSPETVTFAVAPFVNSMQHCGLAVDALFVVDEGHLRGDPRGFEAAGPEHRVKEVTPRIVEHPATREVGVGPPRVDEPRQPVLGDFGRDPAGW